MCNVEKANEAMLYKVNGKKTSMIASNMENNLPRDLQMYKQTDFLQNVFLENTRHEREMELDRMKRLRRMGNNYSGFASTIVKMLNTIE